MRNRMHAHERWGKCEGSSNRRHDNMHLDSKPSGHSSTSFITRHFTACCGFSKNLPSRPAIRPHRSSHAISPPVVDSRKI
ncbi:hypothetical protein SUGI_0587960 [Cryptomeria japonica]|nr:hypothetical protein SUGI_0587960 [Cryptomeria japonica]